MAYFDSLSPGKYSYGAYLSKSGQNPPNKLTQVPIVNGWDFWNFHVCAENTYFSEQYISEQYIYFQKIDPNFQLFTHGRFWSILAWKILMSIPRRKDLDRILQTNSPRCPSCTDHDFDFSCMCREYIFLRTIYFQKTTFYIFFQNLSIPKIFAARSRQIAELEGLAYTPKRAERPTYWNGYPPFFQRIQESRVIAFSVEKRRKTPKVTDLPKCGMSTMFFWKTHFWKTVSIIYK